MSPDVEGEVMRRSQSGRNCTLRCDWLPYLWPRPVSREGYFWMTIAAPKFDATRLPTTCSEGPILIIHEVGDEDMKP